jgi:CRISPR system Cascade subunit CasB
MMTDNPRGYGSRLVEHLIDLARTADQRSESRAALADLRHGAEDPLRMAKHVAPYLPPPNSASDEEKETRLYVLASIFAWHRNHAKDMSLGKAFRTLMSKRDSDSIEGRFLALLAASSDQLETHLRNAVRLLASDNIPLDWHRLKDDVLHWDDEDRRRQRSLARDFYRADATASAGASLEDTMEGESSE